MMHRKSRLDGPWALDDQTAERLLHGSMDPADAPPEYRDVARALLDLSGAPNRMELADQEQWVDQITAVIIEPKSERRVPMWKAKRYGLRLAAPVLALALSVTTGLAVAGALPGPAQDIAAHLLAGVGISAPASDAHPGRRDDKNVKPTRGRVHVAAEPVAASGAATTQAGSGTGQPSGPTSSFAPAPSSPGGGSAPPGSGVAGGHGGGPPGSPPGRGNSNAGGNGNGNAGGNGNGNAGGNGNGHGRGGG